MIVDGTDFLLGDAQIRTVLIISVVAVGDQRVEAVVTAGELQHDEDFPILAARGCGRRLPEQTRGNSGSPAHSDAVHGGAQQIATAGFRKRKALFAHGCDPQLN